jgi:penicillin-binding protein-related factor A (putative recombinase)
MKSVQHILEKSINLDRRCYKKNSQNLIKRRIKNGEVRLIEYVNERRERI